MLDKSLLSAGLLVLALLAFGMWMMEGAKHVDQHGVAHTIAKKMNRDGNPSSDIESAGENTQSESGAGAQSALTSDASTTQEKRPTKDTVQSTESADTAAPATSETQDSKPPIVKTFGNIYKNAEASTEEGNKPESEKAPDTSNPDVKVEVKINGQALKSYSDAYKDKDKDSDQ